MAPGFLCQAAVLPGGTLFFTFVAGRDGRVRYEDGVKKNNACIPRALLPKVYYIDHSRKIEEIQRDIFNIQGGQELKALREKTGACSTAPRPATTALTVWGSLKRRHRPSCPSREAEKLLDYKLFSPEHGFFHGKIKPVFPGKTVPARANCCCIRDMWVSESFFHEYGAL